MKLLKKLRTLFICSLLFPIYPILGIEGDSNNSGDGQNNDGQNDDQNNDSQNDDQNNDSQNNDDGQNNEKVYTQKEIDKIISKRLARERKNYEKEFNSKLEKEKLNDFEKMKLAKAESDQKAEQAILKANKTLIKSEIKIKSLELGIIDADAAYKLIDKDDIEIDDNGNITGVDEALKELISKKTYLVKKQTNDFRTGDDQNNSSGKNNKVNFNDIIRKAAGRS